MAREQEDNIHCDVFADAIYCLLTGETSMYIDPEKIKTNKYMSETTQELSFGQKAVGITFNPGGNDLVNQLKSNFAIVIDHINLCREQTTNPEQKRMYSIAITELQTSQMWAVKAATWQY
jgi:hypothetical protein